MPQPRLRPASDRALLLHAHPHHFIDAARLLEQLLPLLHAAGDGKAVRLDGRISPWLADQLAAWGADLTDLEDGHDAEEDQPHE